MTTYVTFGSDHTYLVNGGRLDYNTVGRVHIPGGTHEEEREYVFKLIGPAFAFAYSEEYPPNFNLYPNGIVDIPYINIKRIEIPGESDE